MLSDEQRKLVEDNMNLVYFYIHKHHLSLDLSDLAFIALCKAALHFDPSRGFKFNTYALRAIENEIALYFRKSGNKILINEINESEFKIKLPDDTDASIFDYVESDLDNKLRAISVYENIDDFTESLSDRDKLIFTSVLFKLKTQNELAKELNYSQAQVSRIFKNLRLKFIDKYYKGMTLDDVKEEIYGKRNNC